MSRWWTGLLHALCSHGIPAPRFAVLAARLGALHYFMAILAHPAFTTSILFMGDSGDIRSITYRRHEKFHLPAVGPGEMMLFPSGNTRGANLNGA